AHIHLLEIEIYRKSIPAPPEPKSKWITTAHIGHLGTRVKCKYSLLQDAANISANATEEDFEMEEDVEDTEENLAAFQMETKEGARVVQEQAEEAEAGAEDASLEEAGEEEEEEDSEEEEEEEEAEDSEEGEENEPAEVEERTQRALLSKASRVKLRDSDEPDMLDEEEAYDGEEDYEEEEEEE
ncbi:ANKRD50, partial [Symbiodinium sp. KB8]